MKNVANILSGSRIIISFLLLFFQAMSVPFLILYACCGVTDMLDGAIASAIVCVITLCSAIEELFCEIKMKEYKPNVKSILELIR